METVYRRLRNGCRAIMNKRTSNTHVHEILAGKENSSLSQNISLRL